MKPSVTTSLLLLLPIAVVNSFSIVASQSLVSSFKTTTRLASEANDENQEQEQGLVLDGLDDQMNKMKGQFEGYELDYLAAARKRAELKVASVNDSSKDEDWQQIADEKKEAYGEIDDWENSKKEAGNVDSQILMFTDSSEDGDDDEGGDGGDSGEQKLLLFWSI